MDQKSQAFPGILFYNKNKKEIVLVLRLSQKFMTRFRYYKQKVESGLENLLNMFLIDC
jgi:hypothetical protein